MYHPGDTFSVREYSDGGARWKLYFDRWPKGSYGLAVRVDSEVWDTEGTEYYSPRSM